MPILLEMIVWGAKYDNKTEAPREFIDKAITDREALAHELLAKLEL